MRYTALPATKAPANANAVSPRASSSPVRSPKTCCQHHAERGAARDAEARRARRAGCGSGPESRRPRRRRAPPARSAAAMRGSRRLSTTTSSTGVAVPAP
jgi:hypothetical protein